MAWVRILRQVSNSYPPNTPPHPTGPLGCFFKDSFYSMRTEYDTSKVLASICIWTKYWAVEYHAMVHAEVMQVPVVLRVQSKANKTKRSQKSRSWPTFPWRRNHFIFLRCLGNEISIESEAGNFFFWRLKNWIRRFVGGLSLGQSFRGLLRWSWMEPRATGDFLYPMQYHQCC